MTLLRCFLILPAMLALAFPVPGRGVVRCGSDMAETTCPMACCAGLLEAGLASDCDCAAAPARPAQPGPAAPVSGSGAEKVPQPGWVSAESRALLSVASVAAVVKGSWLGRADGSPGVSPVGLPVLFCALLT
jgi:hypothetical protein